MSEANLFPSEHNGGKLIRYPLGGCGNVIFPVCSPCYMFHGCTKFIIAATPKGVANYLITSCYEFRGESLHSLSLIRSSPRYVTGTPKGFCHMLLKIRKFVFLCRGGPCGRLRPTFSLLYPSNLYSFGCGQLQGPFHQ